MKAKRILASVLSVALLLQLSPLGVLALDEGLPQTPQVSTVQENLDPAPTEEPTLVEEPALTEEPAPTAEPTPKETAAPTATPTPEPTAEPTATPAPEETAAPDAAAAPAPEPSAEPTAAPDPAVEVQAMINALPDEVTEDNAEAVEQALTDIDDAKQSLTDDELAELDLTRYDAAANALLALWGEAPADAVELLDANYEQPQLVGEWYQITKESELRWFANEVSVKGQTSISAILVYDITLDKTTPWTPIGTFSNQFEGTFNGNNKTISGLNINASTTDNVGLFGYIGKNGTVKNVTVADSYVSGNSCVGGVCGYNEGGIVTGCHNSGKVTGNGYCTGGVCGYNKGTLQECYNTDTVEGTMCVGGVCGLNGNGHTLEKSYNTGTVTGTENVGGVCGQNAESTLQECYNIGTVSGTTKVGGVCGLNYSGTVRNCYYLDTGATTADSGTSKTAAEFKSGEVAYLLQKAINDATTEGTPAEQVWGQKIGEDDYPKLGGDKVYQTTPCTAGYSNTDGTYKAHTPGTDGKCIDCKQLCISYTVTIPATVELGNAANATATISAENITLPTDKTLQVIINGPFTATLVGKTDVTAQYTIQKDGTALTDGSTVLTAQNGESPKIPLTFVKPDAAPYAGSYTGTVTFTVSVGDKTPTT